MVHHGLVQMNLQPTRCNSILDVFLINQPLSISNVEMLPGISYHEAVSVQSDMSVKNLPTIKRKINLWTKADSSTINYLIADFTTTSLNHPIDTPVQQLWDSYKALCVDCLQRVSNTSGLRNSLLIGSTEAAGHH